MPPIPPRFAAHFLPGAELTKKQLKELEGIARLFQECAARTRTADSDDPVSAWNRFCLAPDVESTLKPTPQVDLSDPMEAIRAVKFYSGARRMQIPRDSVPHVRDGRRITTPPNNPCA
jgi:hypothetical protein